VLALGPLLGVAAVVIAVASPLAGSAHSLRLAWLGLASLIAGACTASTAPTTLTLLSRATEDDPRHRTRVMAWFEATTLVGIFGGYALGGVAWDGLSVRAFALLAPLYLLALGLIFLGTPREERTPKDASAPSTLAMLLALARRGGSVAFGLAWLSVNAVVGLWVQHVPYLLRV
jgi:predicted MFS family arabinose efflux permease